MILSQLSSNVRRKGKYELASFLVIIMGKKLFPTTERTSKQYSEGEKE